jgi:hypothetical protein
LDQAPDRAAEAIAYALGLARSAVEVSVLPCPSTRSW